MRGASLAAYAAAAGIQAHIFAPASAPTAKQAHIRAYGAELVTVPGPRAAAAEACLAAAERAVYASHAWSPFFVAGQMTCAWEIFRAVRRARRHSLLRGPWRPFHRDNARLSGPAGCRTDTANAAHGRRPGCRLRSAGAGLGTRLRADNGRDAGSQRGGRDFRGAAGARRGNTAHAARDRRRALRVSEEEILAAQKLLQGRGLLAEPTSAVPVAALLSGRAQLPGRVVIPLTGSGLKMLA